MDLIYLQGGPLARVDGELAIHAKTLSGLLEYRKRWDGDVIVSSLQAPVVANPTGLVGLKEIEDAGVRIVAQTSAEELGQNGPCLVHVAVNAPGADALSGRGFPVVVADDWSPAVRTQVALVGATNALDRTRVRLGAIRRTHRFDRIARAADGMQVNGHAAFSHYRKVNANTHRFFDHRIQAVDIGTARTKPAWDGGRHLTIAFSGRLATLKGVQFIPQLVKQVAERGVDIRFVVMGVGPLEVDLRRAAPTNVEFKGFLEFEQEWKPFVSENVDVMFLPHIQGDSSSTYFEAMGLGVPILGFRNDTLTPLLADGGGGWAVRRGDIDAAAAIVERIASTPGTLQGQRERAFRYMERIPQERIFDERVAHFRGVAG